MCQPIISQTTASGDLINHWIHRAEMDDVNLAKNAEDLKKTLTDPATLMTPGLYTCRAIQLHCADLLQGLDLPDLRQGNLWTDANRQAVADRLTAAFGPLCEGQHTWKTLLKRGSSESRIGTKSQIYKQAIAFRLSREEIARLLLLYRQSWDAHDPLDIAFLSLYNHYMDNLTWHDVLDVLTQFQHALPQNTVQNTAHNAATTGTQELCRIAANSSEKEQDNAGDDAFKAALVAELVKNAAHLTPVTIKIPLKVKIPLEIEIPSYMAGTVRSEKTYACTRSAAKAMNGLLKLLAVLYPVVYEVKNETHDGLTKEVAGYTRYPLTPEGLPEHRSDLFTAMLDCIGVPNTEREKTDRKKTDQEGTDLVDSLCNRLKSPLKEDCDETANVLEGTEPDSRTLDHDDVLLLTWFLIRGVLSGEHAEELTAWREALPDRAPDLFTRRADCILDEIQSIRQAGDANAQLEQTQKTYNMVLDVFSSAGLYSMSHIYLPRPMDRFVVASILYPYQNGQKLWEAEQNMTTDDKLTFTPSWDETILELVGTLLGVV